MYQSIIVSIDLALVTFLLIYSSINIDSKKPSVNSLLQFSILMSFIFGLMTSIISIVKQSVLISLIASSIYFITSILLYIFIKKSKKQKFTKLFKRNPKELVIIAMIISILLVDFSGFIMHKANRKGMLNNRPNYQLTYSEYFDNKDKTLEQTVWKIEQLGDSSLIALYRYGCQACEAHHEELLNLKNKIKVEFVESRSELGKELVRLYELKFVPSILMWAKVNNQYESFTITELKEDPINQQKLDEFIETRIK